MILNKSVGELKWAYEQIWQNRKPLKIWFDRERAIDSHEFKEFLEAHNVELYHIFSEIKCSVPERMIRTLKEKCERIKTEYELLAKPYNLVDVLPEVLRIYNYETVHSAHKMTPVDASRRENEETIQKILSGKVR